MYAEDGDEQHVFDDYRTILTDLRADIAARNAAAQPPPTHAPPPSSKTADDAILVPNIHTWEQLDSDEQKQHIRLYVADTYTHVSAEWSARVCAFLIGAMHTDDFVKRLMWSGQCISTISDVVLNTDGDSDAADVADWQNVDDDEMFMVCFRSSTKSNTKHGRR